MPGMEDLLAGLLQGGIGFGEAYLSDNERKRAQAEKIAEAENLAEKEKSNFLRQAILRGVSSEDPKLRSSSVKELNKIGGSDFAFTEPSELEGMRFDITPEMEVELGLSGSGLAGAKLNFDDLGKLQKMLETRRSNLVNEAISNKRANRHRDTVIGPKETRDLSDKELDNKLETVRRTLAGFYQSGYGKSKIKPGYEELVSSYMSILEALTLEQRRRLSLGGETTGNVPAVSPDGVPFYLESGNKPSNIPKNFKDMSDDEFMKQGAKLFGGE